ncbi:xanthine dehydrogenase accessory protein XdhC [Alteromonadaceae bacterium M269]|nr:xanthine dehydrogenase accessory protein XdhC [Alteromonadaceae bacterium M269]
MDTNRWFDALHKHQTKGLNYVLVTVLSSAGSTPRENGAKMLVTAEQTFDTIGGGHLEHAVTQKARELLAQNKQAQLVEHYPLSSKLGQCCGGATHILFEVMVNHGQPLAIFGSGHVAKALVPILSQLPLKISWIDSRAELFPHNHAGEANVDCIVVDEPSEIVRDLAENSGILIMTHNHQLDFDIVRQALSRPDISYLGMIGSETKARRFQTRLAHREFSEEQISRLISPVGLLDVPGKQPIEVAVSISAQIIQWLDKQKSHSSLAETDNKLAWKTSKVLSDIL